MSEKVKEILSYGSESYSIDFKKSQYSIEKHAKKHEKYGNMTINMDVNALSNS